MIIEIFTRHARTKESKTQVELARLTYLLPRLTHFWSHFERQRGGGVNSRGMGETQIEVDSRLVKRRMSVLRDRLEGIERERVTQRSGRREVLKVALVGYTNAGKSTLLNGLTESDVLAENKLFATLDASVRSLDPNSHPPVVAIDTVGFDQSAAAFADRVVSLDARGARTGGSIGARGGRKLGAGARGARGHRAGADRAQSRR